MNSQYINSTNLFYSPEGNKYIKSCVYLFALSLSLEDSTQISGAHTKNNIFFKKKKIKA
jgi:hypothetical protein